MRVLRILIVSIVVCLGAILTLPTQAQEILSPGCQLLNNPLPWAPIPPFGPGVSGAVSVGFFNTQYFEAGEVISLGGPTGLTGTLALTSQNSSEIYASVSLPERVIFTIPVSGFYRFYFQISNLYNPTTETIEVIFTVSCGHPENPTEDTSGLLLRLPESVVYATEDGIVVYVTNPLNPIQAFASVAISADELAEYPAQPEENTLLASSVDGYINIYLLTTGEYQINIGPDAEGKVIIVIFTGLPPTNVYRRDFNVNDILYPES